ncbi:MAG: Uma2 family endonuclease, partial [Dehalococcoidia bacterium]|nr:Uma2 family endonuclease [Dehalococcoidia bacterium]
MALTLTRRRFTVEQYHEMAAAGILNGDDRVELIDGEVTEMTPIGPRHASCEKRLNSLLMKTFGDDVVIGVHDPVTLDHYSEPQPDPELLRPRPDFYGAGHLAPKDVSVLVEVAETSAELDR